MNLLDLLNKVQEIDSINWNKNILETNISESGSKIINLQNYIEELKTQKWLDEISFENIKEDQIMANAQFDLIYEDCKNTLDFTDKENIRKINIAEKRMSLELTKWLWI